MFEEEATSVAGLNPLHTLIFMPSELDIVKRPIEGDGGHQRLLKELHQQLNGDRLIIGEYQLRKAYDYAVKGHGGHQDRFKVIVHAAWRSGWVQPD